MLIGRRPRADLPAPSFATLPAPRSGSKALLFSPLNRPADFADILYKETAMSEELTNIKTELRWLPTLEHILHRRSQKRNVNEEHAASLRPMERLALWITDNVGTMGFFLIILFWTVGWMAWNTLAERQHFAGEFDKPWVFAIWLFISNLIQIHLMPLIMVGQNLQSRHAEMRAEHAFEITQQTEREMEVVLRYLASIHESLQRLEQQSPDGKPQIREETEFVTAR
jgi:uncharacterized membrane protein